MKKTFQELFFKKKEKIINPEPAPAQITTSKQMKRPQSAQSRQPVGVQGILPQNFHKRVVEIEIQLAIKGTQKPDEQYAKQVQELMGLYQVSCFF
jgi:hypothetical protein